jgi:hypothetical protein
MSIEADELKKIIKNFLKVIEKREVLSLLDYEQPEKRFPIPDKQNEYISVAFRPSSNHLMPLYKTPKISYHIIGCGIPSEVVINPYEGYSRIILKTVMGILPGYEPFAIDRYDNIAQHKKLSSTDISEVRRELENLLDKI